MYITEETKLLEAELATYNVDMPKKRSAMTIIHYRNLLNEALSKAKEAKAKTISVMPEGITKNPVLKVARTATERGEYLSDLRKQNIKKGK